MELYFKAKADFEEIIRMRQEVERLQRKLDEADKRDPKAYKKLYKDLARAEKQFDQLSRKAALNSEKLKRNHTEVELLSKGFHKLGTTIGVGVSAVALQGITREIVRVRGEFQQLEVAFETMLGNKAKADKLMADVVAFAAKTPFELSQSAGGAKQLMAYGVEAENVIPTLKALGDVSAGLSVPIERLILNYGQVKTQLKLTGREMRDFQMAGVPLLAELAKNLNKTEKEVQEMISAGNIGFKEVEQAFRSMSSEGGRFANLMDKQSSTITGKISNLRDNVEVMFNEIGKDKEGLINGTIDMAGKLVENYEKIGREIVALATAYGSYRAVLITLSAVENKRRAIMVMVNQMARVQMSLNKAITKSEAVRIVQTKLLTKALWMQTKAQIKSNLAALANPYVAVAVAVGALAYGIYKLVTAETSAERATRLVNEQMEERKRLAEESSNKLSELIGVIQDETSTQRQKEKALTDLQTLYPTIFKNMDVEAVKVAKLRDLQKEHNAEIERRNDLADREKVKELDKKIKELENSKNAVHIGGQYGSGMTAFSYQREIDKLKDERQAYQNRINSEEKAKKEAEFNALSGNEQLTRLAIERQRIEANKELYWGDTYDRLLQENAKKQQKAKEKIKKAQKNVLSLTELNKKIAKEQNELKKLQSKFKADTNNSKLAEDIKSKQGEIKALEEKAKLAGQTKTKAKASGDTPQQQAEKRLQEQERINAQQLQQEREREDRAFEIRQNGINQEENQNKKRQKQIQLDFEIRNKNIERRQADELAKYKAYVKEKARTEHIAKHGNDDTFSFDTEQVQLPTEWVRQFDKMREQNADIQRAENGALLNDMLEKYKDYKKKIQEIDEQYNAEWKNLSEQGFKEGGVVHEKHLKERKEAIEKVGKEILREEEANMKGLLELYENGNGASLIESELKKALPLFHDISSLTFEELKKAKTVVSGLKLPDSLLEKLKEAGIDTEKLVEALENAKKSSDEALDVRKWEKVAEQAERLANSVSRLGAELGNFGGALGEIGGVLSGLSEGVTNVVGIIKEAKKEGGANPANVIAIGIDGISDFVSMVGRQIKENKKAQADWNAKIRESEHRLRLLRIEQAQYKNNDIFGTGNPYEKAIAGAKTYALAMGELNQMRHNLADGKIQDGTKKVVSGGNVAKGAGSGAAAGAAIGTAIGGWAFGLGTLIGAGIGAIVGAAGGALAKKTVPVFKSLKEKFGTIIKEGSETYELNPEILANYEKLDDATKKTVDNWEEIRQKALEAKEEMSRAFKELAGDLGGNLSNALVDAFRNGDIRSALDSFQKDVNKVIEGLIAQLAFSTYFKKYFDQLEEDMGKSMGEDGDGDIVDDIIRATQGINGGLEGYSEMLERLQKELKKQGIDILQPGEKKQGAAAYGAYEKITHEQADRIDGRMTAIQMACLEQVDLYKKYMMLGGETLQELRVGNDIQDEMRLSTQAMAKHLALISGHTSVLPESNETLKKIAKNTAKL